MLMLLLVAVLLIPALTVVLHAIGTTYWIRYAVRRYGDHMAISSHTRRCRR